MNKYSPPPILERIPASLEEGAKNVRDAWIWSQYQKGGPIPEHHLYSYNDPRFSEEHRQEDRVIFDVIRAPYAHYIDALETALLEHLNTCNDLLARNAQLETALGFAPQQEERHNA